MLTSELSSTVFIPPRTDQSEIDGVPYNDPGIQPSIMRPNIDDGLAVHLP